MDVAHVGAKREAEEVAVDVSAVMTLARAFLPGMLARRSGGILNVASAIAFQPAPYQAEYGASKAFVLSFSHTGRARHSSSRSVRRCGPKPGRAASQ
jgi:short-subunit dehydrogenase